MDTHLGNVRTVVSDRRGYVSIAGDLSITNEPELVAWTDYYAYGMRMNGRSESTSEYRYGFQGQEMDNEIKGEGNSINYKYRMHDPRIGRFFAVDPLAAKYPHNSVYAFSENVVIDHVELEGLEKGSIDPAYVRGLAMAMTISNRILVTEIENSMIRDILRADFHHAVRDWAYFVNNGRDLSARGIARYLEGKAGYDIYSIKSIVASADGKYNTFEWVNEQIRSKFKKSFSTKFKDGSITYNNDQGSLEENSWYSQKAPFRKGDFGTTFGSFNVKARTEFTTSTKENDLNVIEGTIYYTFYDTYRWHPEKLTTNWLFGFLSHEGYEGLKIVGAAEFTTISYYKQSFITVNGVTTYGDYEDSYDLNKHREPTTIEEGELGNDFRGEEDEN